MRNNGVSRDIMVRVILAPTFLVTLPKQLRVMDTFGGMCIYDVKS